MGQQHQQIYECYFGYVWIGRMSVSKILTNTLNIAHSEADFEDENENTQEAMLCHSFKALVSLVSVGPTGYFT